VKDYLETQYCSVHGDAAQKVILHPPRVFSDLPGYESPASGKWIEGRAARARDFAETGTRPYEIGEGQQAAKRVEQEFEKNVSNAVDEAVERSLTELSL
jgi:hypothetical protein